MPKERVLPGKISYEKLFERMGKKGIKQADLSKLEPNPIHPSTIQKIETRDKKNTDTIIILCDALNCQPKDIMEYIPNETHER